MHELSMFETRLRQLEHQAEMDYSRMNITCPYCCNKHSQMQMSMSRVRDTIEEGAVYQCSKCKREYRAEWKNTWPGNAWVIIIVEV